MLLSKNKNKKMKQHSIRPVEYNKYIFIDILSNEFNMTNFYFNEILKSKLFINQLSMTYTL